MTEEKNKKHVDGSPCYEGIQRIPDQYRPCCNVFEYHTYSCSADIRYEYRAENRWVIAIYGSKSGIHISYCPHCGSYLYAKGIKPEEVNHPSARIFDCHNAPQEGPAGPH